VQIPEKKLSWVYMYCTKESKFPQTDAFLSRKMCKMRFGRAMLQTLLESRLRGSTYKGRKMGDYFKRS